MFAMSLMINNVPRVNNTRNFASLIISIEADIKFHDLEHVNESVSPVNELLSIVKVCCSVYACRNHLLFLF